MGLQFNYLHSSALEDCDSSRVTSTYYQIQYQVHTFHKALLISSAEGKAILLHAAGYKKLADGKENELST